MKLNKYSGWDVEKIIKRKIDHCHVHERDVESKLVMCEKFMKESKVIALSIWPITIVGGFALYKATDMAINAENIIRLCALPIVFTGIFGSDYMQCSNNKAKLKKLLVAISEAIAELEDKSKNKAVYTDNSKIKILSKSRNLGIYDFSRNVLN